MKKLRVIHTKATISTMRSTGELGLTGIYLVFAEIEFEGVECYVIKDWDGEGEATYIVNKIYIDDENDVEVFETIDRRDLDEWLRHPKLVSESWKTRYHESWLMSNK